MSTTLRSRHHEDHGHSVAAWTLVILLLIGATLISIGIAWEITWPVVVGIVCCVVGGLSGKILQIAGYGKPQHVRRVQP